MLNVNDANISMTFSTCNFRVLFVIESNIWKMSSVLPEHDGPQTAMNSLSLVEASD